MKNKITCLLAGVALFGATANADIAIADGLSAYGYIDMVAEDLEGGARSSDLVEYEIGLSFTPAESQWSAVAELSYGEIDSGASLETVAVSYQYSDALSFTFGQVYTYMGLESVDAPNNSFISFAGAGNNMLYNDTTFAEGICADYSAGDITLGIWGEASANAGFEYYVAYSGIDNLTLSAAIADNRISAGFEDVVNIMAVYEVGDFTISAEDVDVDNILDVSSVSVAYGLGDTTIAVRFVEGDYAGVDYDKTSIAAFHSLSDNVAVGAEYSDEELGGADTKGVAVELLYVF
jgi:hypothetical protein